MGAFYSENLFWQAFPCYGMTCLWRLPHPRRQLNDNQLNFLYTKAMEIGQALQCGEGLLFHDQRPENGLHEKNRDFATKFKEPGSLAWVKTRKLRVRS
jgi:hypothetical protein